MEVYEEGAAEQRGGGIVPVVDLELDGIPWSAVRVDGLDLSEQQVAGGAAATSVTPAVGLVGGFPRLRLPLRKVVDGEGEVPLVGEVVEVHLDLLGCATYCPVPIPQGGDVDYGAGVPVVLVVKSVNAESDDEIVGGGGPEAFGECVGERCRVGVLDAALGAVGVVVE